MTSVATVATAAVACSCARARSPPCPIRTCRELARSRACRRNRQRHFIAAKKKQNSPVARPRARLVVDATKKQCVRKLCAARQELASSKLATNDDDDNKSHSRVFASARGSFCQPPVSNKKQSQIAHLIVARAQELSKLHQIAFVEWPKNKIGLFGFDAYFHSICVGTRQFSF